MARFEYASANLAGTISLVWSTRVPYELSPAQPIYEGRRARTYGWPITTCPRYTDPEFVSLWRSGWYAEDASPTLSLTTRYYAT